MHLVANPLAALEAFESLAGAAGGAAVLVRKRRNGRGGNEECATHHPQQISSPVLAPPRMDIVMGCWGLWVHGILISSVSANGVVRTAQAVLL